jgi:uncharacterized protein with von Willebrand factor type A (vWA) domain
MLLTRLQLAAIGALAAILLVIAVVQSVRLDGFLWIDGVLDREENLTRDNNELRAAVKEAERLNDQQVDRIVTDQEKVNEARLADLTARLERLRSELRSKAPQGSAGSPKAGADGEAPANPDGEAGLCLAPDELLRAAENEERHDQLITWINEQLQVAR